MNILLLWENMEVGGTQKELLSLCRCLKMLGHHLAIASNGGRLVREINNLGIQHYSVPHRTGRKAYIPLSLLSFPFSFYRITRIAEHEHCDLVHVGTGLFPTALGFLVCRLLRIPFVVTINDGILDRGYKIAVLRSVNLTKYVDKMLFISQEMKDLIHDITPSRDKDQRVSIIPNMIELDQYEGDTDTSFRETARTKRILWVGRLSQDKVSAVVNLVRAIPMIAERVPDIELFVVGAGPAYDEIARLANVINENLGKKVVLLTGYLKDVIPMMKSADLIIGMGKVAIEGMACGKPVLVLGHFFGPFGGNFGGLITEANAMHLGRHNYSGRDSRLKNTPERIAQSCITVLSNKEYAHSLGEFGRNFVRRNHEAVAIVKRIVSLYKEALRMHQMERGMLSNATEFARTLKSTATTIACFDPAKYADSWNPIWNCGSEESE